MKRITFILLLVSVMASNACKNESSDVNKAKSIVDDIENSSTPSDLKALKNKEPLNRQELEDTFPFRLGDYERSYFLVSEEMGNAKGSFNDGHITLSITDAAGAMGSQIITLFNALYDLEDPNDLSKKPLETIKKRLKYFNKIPTNQVLNLYT